MMLSCAKNRKKTFLRISLLFAEEPHVNPRGLPAAEVTEMTKGHVEDRNAEYLI